MMFIADNDISLRIAEPGDAEQIYRWENDRSLWRVSETSAPTSLFQIEQFLLSNSDWIANRQLRLMIESPQEKEPVGCVDLFEYDPIHQRAGIGILIAEPYRGKGYATRAVKLTLEYLFKDLLLHQVHCLVDAQNTHSQQLFESLGFQRCGLRKDWIKTPEGYLDVIFYQLLTH